MLKMNRKEIKEVLTGISNLLDGTERNELIKFIISISSAPELYKMLEHCQNNFSIETRISLEENGIFEEE